MTIRLRLVHVSGLFGDRNTAFEVPSGQRISLLHGPNGIGKSTVLRMVFNLLTCNFVALQNTPFEQFTATLESDDRSVTVDAREHAAGLELAIHGVSEGAGPWPIERFSDDDRLAFNRYLEEHLPELVYLPSGRYWDETGARDLTLIEVLAVVQERATTERASHTGYPPEVVDAMPSFDIEYIGADRLRNDLAPSARGPLGSAPGVGSVAALYRHRQDLARRLRAAAEPRLDAQVALFTELVNGKLTGKTVEVSADAGFVILDGRGAPLEPAVLSSGEQHQILLLYRTLFRDEPGGLFLIDEPEISLHVAWQEEFLDDLVRITELNDSQAIIATHSPVIIGDHYDLMVEVVSPDES